MNRLRSFYLFALSICFLLSCNTTKKLAVPDINDTALNLPAKTTRLTATQLQTWGHADLATDTIPGISLAKAYTFLAGKTSTTVIAAVTDTGIDIDHADLKPVIWTNGDDPVDGKDNDGNGFVDDINGWNFLGDTYDENLEMTRMVRMFKAEFGDKKMKEIAPEKVADFKLYQKLAKQVGDSYHGSGTYYNVDFNARKGQPDPYDYAVKVYGNGNVKNSDNSEAHASHVAGIIGAARDGKGVEGIADNVQIMSLRVVPKGDEYDKDVALGIRYAVDNGAKVINASFGKSYSPKATWVHDAIKYAAEKDVVIVLSSGNSGENIDVAPNFPNDTPTYGQPEIANNVITVGANTYNYDESLPAAFSNYGKKNVDIFAPGVTILSTVPSGKYRAMGGTSMAAPAVAGVVALIRSYYPKLSANQVKQIIMKSGTKIDFKVMTPGSEPTLVPFTDLCISGRILNAYEAVKLADLMNGKI
ncbi:MAG: S8 family serine peptidase [Saprospiraceae bacterium]